LIDRATSPRKEGRITLAGATDAVASALAMSVIAKHGSAKDRAKAVAWLKTWFRVFSDSPK